MATTKKQATEMGIQFDATPPTQDRTSRYDELYEALRENLQPGKWADVTDAIANIAKQSESGKVPKPQAAAVTLRKHGFQATARGDRIYAGLPEADTDDES